ncbi:hypothetical protein Aeq9CBH6_21520 [Adlercreutzia equolifaciens]|nr:hypothetical protein Aeq9CBH6_21520 [Adlercreutzia equolifaciens]
MSQSDQMGCGNSKERGIREQHGFSTPSEMRLSMDEMLPETRGPNSSSTGPTAEFETKTLTAETLIRLADSQK